MDTHKRSREHISALVDGELPSADAELAMAELASAEGQAAWRDYHLIGAVLRETAAAPLSAAFSARLAARLAAEAPPARRAGAAAPAADTALRTPIAAAPSS